jgi:RelE-like toxin of type II toxin-antitoxin system HigB
MQALSFLLTLFLADFLACSGSFFCSTAPQAFFCPDRRFPTPKQLDNLRVPPGNRFEALRGEREGQSSIRINDQWRICFVWRDGETWDVEIADYH